MRDGARSNRPQTNFSHRSYFAETVRINTAKTTKTKLTTRESRLWNGCAWKKLSPDLLKCIRRFMINLLRRSGSRLVFNLWPAVPYLLLNTFRSDVAVISAILFLAPASGVCSVTSDP